MQLTRFLLTAALLALVPSSAVAQALPNLSISRLGYTVRKRTVNAQGELKTKLDALDAELDQATRLGKNGEVRRLLAKGMTLLAGREWTGELDFSQSLLLRSDRVYVDSLAPYPVRLEQMYSPSIQLQRALTARVSLRKAPPMAGPAGPSQPGEIVKDLGAFEEVSRDLRESPHFMDLGLAGVADGVYQVLAEVLEGDRALGSASLRIVIQKGLDGTLSRLKAEATQAPEVIRAEALYPIDYIRKVNRGLIDRGAFDLTKELATAEQALAAAKAGKDPFAGRTGDFKRHYYFQAAGEIMPYRMYVPPPYTGAKAFPLVVALHGLGGTEDSMFSGIYRLVEQAEKRGYIVVAPLGYRIDGGYGFGLFGPPTRRTQLSEQDVMEVLERVRRDYKVDESRIYLMGHSMGGIGTWALAAKYPSLWAALGPIAGIGNPATVEKIRHIPEIVVHGDADNVVPVSSSRVMVEAMKKLGGEVQYIEVPGGDHTNIAAPNMGAIFDFFDSHRKAAAPSSSR